MQSTKRVGEMRAEGWHLDIYCDVPGCKNQETRFYGSSKADTHRKIRLLGWVLRRIADVCPEHASMSLNQLRWCLAAQERE